MQDMSGVLPTYQMQPGYWHNLQLCSQARKWQKGSQNSTGCEFLSASSYGYVSWFTAVCMAQRQLI